MKTALICFDKLGRRKTPRKLQSISQRLFRFIELIPFHSCWEWTGAKYLNGYGHMTIRKKTISAHRVSYRLHKGPIPDGMCVLHRCDNRSCVNPDHLFLGSKKENTQDAIGKRRIAFGEKHGRSKLSAKQIEEIRARYTKGNIFQKELANEFSVSQTTISKIVLRKKWRHI